MREVEGRSESLSTQKRKGSDWGRVGVTGGWVLNEVFTVG